MILADVYVNHGEALEYDLFHLWNMDINDPRMTVRRLRNFFFRLPYKSETMMDIAEIQKEARVWDPNTYMLANIYDAITHLDWVTVSVNSKHAQRPPKVYPRPELKKIVKTKRNMWPGKTIVDKGVKSG